MNGLIFKEVSKHLLFQNYENDNDNDNDNDNNNLKVIFD
jgi:hypothetical protein